MDGRDFDALTRRFATKRPRRAVLKGLLGLSGAAAVVTVAPDRGDAAWSTLVCLPDGAGGFIARLVPTVAVPLYVRGYGAMLAENGSCAPVRPGPDTCESLCGGDWCVYLANDDVRCAAHDVARDCSPICTSDADCGDAQLSCIVEVKNASGSVLPSGCDSDGNLCGSID